MSSIFSLGIDIGGTNFRMGVVGGDGQIHAFTRTPSNVFETGDAKEILLREIKVYLKQSGFEGRIKAAAIGIPAIVSKDKKTVYSSPNLRGFDGITFTPEFEQALGFPVYVDRDVNFLLQNDIAKLGLSGEKTVIGFYIGTGFGNAISFSGRFYSGSNGVAGELGHIPILDSEDRCTCGNIGCIETRCSGKALEELAEKHFPQTDIKKVFLNHPKSPELKKFVTDLAIPIATEINILDPDCCIIGGGVTDMESFPKEILTDAIREYVRKPYPAQNLNIIFTKHDQQSGVFGSGDYALNEYLRQIGNNITNK
ncbi:MAG: allose kinase [Clostridia bacterium]|nr:allose kinase [Clostridia bacterium]